LNKRELYARRINHFQNKTQAPDQVFCISQQQGLSTWYCRRIRRVDQLHSQRTQPTHRSRLPPAGTKPEESQLQSQHPPSLICSRTKINSFFFGYRASDRSSDGTSG